MIENVYEGLDEDGEWYYDKSTRMLHYLNSSISADDAGSIVAVVPQRERVLFLGGATNASSDQVPRVQDQDGGVEEVRGGLNHQDRQIAVQDLRIALTKGGYMLRYYVGIPAPYAGCGAPKVQRP